MEEKREGHLPEEATLEVDLRGDAVCFCGPGHDFERRAQRVVRSPLGEGRELVFQSRRAGVLVLASRERAVDDEGGCGFDDG